MKRAQNESRGALRITFFGVELLHGINPFLRIHGSIDSRECMPLFLHLKLYNAVYVQVG